MIQLAAFSSRSIADNVVVPMVVQEKVIDPNDKNRQAQAAYFKNMMAVAACQMIVCYFIVKRTDFEIETVIQV